MTRASDTARLLGAGATILDGTTISTADNTAQLTLTSTDADGSRGPQLALTRTSASPADNDLCGVFKINGKNDAAEDFELGEIVFTSTDVSNGSEDSKITINGIVAGASAGRLNMTPSEAVFNEDSLDIDFRVESNGNANMLFVDGGNDRVGIGITPSTTFDVLRNGSGVQTVANFAAHNYGDAAATYIQIGTEYTDGSSRIGSINNGDSGGGNTSALVFETMNTTAGSFTERMRIRHDGRVNIPNAYTETTGNSANLFVDTDGRLIRATSSERYKNTITDATHGLTELLKLRSVTYKGNNDGDTVFGGLIAEEVHDAGLTEFVQYNTDNQPDALAYGNMVSLCIKAIQELSAKVTALENA